MIREGDDVWEELDSKDELELAVAERVSIDTLLCRSTPYGTLLSETTQYDGVDRYPLVLIDIRSGLHPVRCKYLCSPSLSTLLLSRIRRGVVLSRSFMLPSAKP